MFEIIDFTNSLEEARALSLAPSIEITFIIKYKVPFLFLPIVLKKEVKNKVISFKGVELLFTLELYPFNKFDNCT